MKMRISRKNLKLTSLFVLIIALAAIAIFAYREYYMPITSWDYGSEVVNFRNDLREASKVEVLPNEEWVSSTLFSPFLRNITIVFKSDSPDIGLVGVQAIEITNKLGKAYKQAGVVLMSESSFMESSMTAIPEGYVVISAKPIDSYRNLTGSFTTALIVLIPPSETKVTAVKASNNAIFISGKDATDFDLATIKFLMIAMGIKIS